MHSQIEITSFITAPHRTNKQKINMPKKSNNDVPEYNLMNSGNQAKIYNLNSKGPTELNSLKGQRFPIQGNDNYEHFFDCIDEQKACSSTEKAAAVENFYSTFNKLSSLPKRIKDYIKENNVKKLRKPGQDTITSWTWLFRGKEQAKRYKETWEEKNKGKKFADAVATVNNAWPEFVANESKIIKKPKHKKKTTNSATTMAEASEATTEHATQVAHKPRRSIKPTNNTLKQKKATTSKDKQKHHHDLRKKRPPTEADNDNVNDSSTTKNQTPPKKKPKTEHPVNIAGPPNSDNSNGNATDHPTNVTAPPQSDNNKGKPTATTHDTSRQLFHKPDSSDGNTIAKRATQNNETKEQFVTKMKGLGFADEIILQLLQQKYNIQSPEAYFEQLRESNITDDWIIEWFPNAYGGLRAPLHLTRSTPPQAASLPTDNTTSPPTPSTRKNTVQQSDDSLQDDNNVDEESQHSHDSESDDDIEDDDHLFA
jgi:hypothetical protein